MVDRPTYDTWQALILQWFQGTLTTPELIREGAAHIDIGAEGWPEIDLVAAFESALRKFDERYYFRWLDRKEYATDTAPTVRGLVHNLERLIAGLQTRENFLEWASWHNVDPGETTSGIFENDRIEYFCLDFLPHFYTTLDAAYFERVLESIKRCSQITRSAFICLLYIHHDEHRSGMEYVLKDYLKGKRDDTDLDGYFQKKFGFSASDLPYFSELRAARATGDDSIPVVKLLFSGGL